MEINDLHTTELFQEISDEESLTIGGGISAGQLSNNLYLAGSGLAGAGLVSSAFGPVGIGVGLALGIGGAGLAGLGAIAGMYSSGGGGGGGLRIPRQML